MIRNLKALGLALVAVFAMSAVMASGASAHEFTSEVSPTSITGTTEAGTVDKFTIGSLIGTLTVECHGEFSGTQTGTSADTLTVNAVYSGCKFNGENSPVDMNGCDYKFGSDTDANGHANVDVICPTPEETSKFIAITNPLCTIYVAGQNTGRGVHYTNITENGKGAVTVTSTVDVAIKEKVVKPGGTCFGLANTGVYESTAIVTGYKDGEPHTLANQVGISVD